jgi:mRNA interferase MazF
MTGVFSQGDIVEFDFGPSQGHEPLGRRPALVVSSDDFNASTSMTLVCPITTADSGFPLHMPLPDGIDTYGYVVVEQVRAFDLYARNPRLVEHLDAECAIMLAVTECLRSFF